MESAQITTWGEGMMESLIAIGNDETASIYLHKNAIKFITKEVDKDID
mgnify:CR=1 FL=1